MEFNSSAELREAWLGGFGEQGVLGDLLRLFMKRLCGGVFYRNSAVRIFGGRTFPVPRLSAVVAALGVPASPGWSPVMCARRVCSRWRRSLSLACRGVLENGSSSLHM